jgi:hypothetical protein
MLAAWQLTCQMAYRVHVACSSCFDRRLDAVVMPGNPSMASTFVGSSTQHEVLRYWTVYTVDSTWVIGCTVHPQYAGSGCAVPGNNTSERLHDPVGLGQALQPLQPAWP